MAAVSRRSPVLAVVAQHAAYLSRNPRYWFLSAYGPIITSLALSKGFKDYGHDARVFLLILACISASTAFLFNMFGLDGSGASQWLTLPVSRAEVLRAKAAASVAATAIGCMTSILLNRFFLHSSFTMVITGFLLFVTVVLFAATAGMFTSLRFPLPVSINALFSRFLPPETAGAIFATMAAALGASAGAWWLGNRLMIGPLWPQAAVLCLAVVAFRTASVIAANDKAIKYEDFLERLVQNG